MSTSFHSLTCDQQHAVNAYMGKRIRQHTLEQITLFALAAALAGMYFLPLPWWAWIIPVAPFLAYVFQAGKVAQSALQEALNRGVPEETISSTMRLIYGKRFRLP
ncbi:hypothetical protein SAMN05216576_107136 [Ectopseudomonas chengduensis]|uniref:Uncharacterized protein n=3 Tax=Ectopseudomonas TaxID=3236654 RepID=A0A1G6PZ35_9GAMM|nr:hypothetical protein [Pseudomonas chengduensis]ALN21863.1 hypothetical protein DW68_024610 [Pseudomonas mendocina S5.2]KER98082.1 hypothetical protein HN51_25105 [Pseudomonas mendocina]NNB75258.1 hypothetical protein [Pseudomonas chengduensis]SDC84657.1 hypothetical protein SAMN05216576_107136 [Pseudomonas chengduensis]